LRPPFLDTVECQINFTLRLIAPIIRSLPSYRSASLLPSFLASPTSTVEVRLAAARQDSEWTQSEAKKLVWASGCVNWAVDERTGLNNMMYPDWQYWYWFRSVFFKKNDFVYRVEGSGEVAGAEWGRALAWLVGTGLLVGGAFAGRDFIMDGAKRLRGLDVKALMGSVKV
jgi:hypothetical protein